MRHDLLSRAMTGRSRCMLQPPAKALLIALAGRSLRARSRLLCTAARTINLASQWLQTKTGARHRTHKNRRGGAVCVPDDSGCGRERQRMEYCPGIRAQHGVGARRRYETWQLRSAPCLSQSTQQVAPTQCVLATPKSRARRAMACGYVDNARALPTYPQAQ